MSIKVLSFQVQAGSSNTIALLLEGDPAALHGLVMTLMGGTAPSAPVAAPSAPSAPVAAPSARKPRTPAPAPAPAPVAAPVAAPAPVAVEEEEEDDDDGFAGAPAPVSTLAPALMAELVAAPKLRDVLVLLTTKGALTTKAAVLQACLDHQAAIPTLARIGAELGERVERAASLLNLQ